MKRFLHSIGYRPSKNDILVLSWFVLICGLIASGIGLAQGEPRPFRVLCGCCVVFILGLYAHHKR
jgi:hypothetical protein